MSEGADWNDESREALRETLRWFILGELRLAKNGHESILEECREVYIESDCPENEQSTFVQFAAEELKRTVARLADEKQQWPEFTDCDRLDRVEVDLRERGILLWQVSPCCDTCTVGELSHRINVINRRHPGFRDRMRGYAFFIDQNMPDMLSGSTEVSLYLGYGWLSPDHAEVPQETYKANALAIAREVCECLRDEGIEVDWNGDLSRKIGITMNWQRRELLQ